MMELKSVTNDKRLRKSSQATSRPMGAVEVLLHLETSYYYTLNPTGAKIWRYCSKERSIQEIVAFVANHYGVSKTKTAKDLTAYVETLVKEKLLEISD